MNWKITSLGDNSFDFGGIDFEFGGLRPLASTSVESHNFLITLSGGIDFFPHISNSMLKNVNGINHLIENLPL